MPSFLLGVSLSSWNRVLGRTLTLAHGEASGFFYAQKAELEYVFVVIYSLISHSYNHHINT